MINSKQRAYLRSLSQNLDTIFQIGKGGITEETCNQIFNALEARELIDLSGLDDEDIATVKQMVTALRKKRS